MEGATTGDSRVGSVLQGRYRITDQISSGGMGVVYRGERIGIGRAVAIKFLHAAYSTMSDLVERFEREAKLTSRLEHPNVVSVIDFGVDVSPYIVMDYVAGQTLQDLLFDGAVEPTRAINIVRQMLAGLAHAHERGIIHRDIKPANVMLTAATEAGDYVQLLDFGLAKLKDVDMTSSSVVVGTPRYMSPEQAGGAKADARSDIYATGAVLFELLTGTKLFDAEEPLALLKMHIDEPPPSLASRHPSGTFSKELESVVQKSLAKDPGERYQSATEMLTALRDCGGSAGMRLRTVPGEQSRTERRRRAPRKRSGARAVIVAAKWLAVPLAVVAIWWAAGKPGFGDVERKIDQLGTTGVGEDEADKSSSSSADSGAADIEKRIAKLNAERREKPSSRVYLELGNLYFEKEWDLEGLASYKSALQGDDKLKSNKTVIRNTISALASEQTRQQAKVVLVKSIGKPALRELRAAQKSRPELKGVIREVIRAIR